MSSFLTCLDVPSIIFVTINHDVSMCDNLGTDVVIDSYE